jgi:hypothetical protein
MPNIPCRLIHEVGTRISLRRYWQGGCSHSSSYHNAQRLLFDSPQNGDWTAGGDTKDYPDDQWPATCEHCGTPVPEDAEKQIFRKILYNTESGKPEPGDMYYAGWYHPDGICRWDNCKDHRGHLMVVLPNGRIWDLNSRASNCTMPDDKLHRCWVLHGEAPHLTADKNGLTCAAGAGSILAGDYHGFLINGELTQC